jgi:hypothetical protein
MKKITLLFIIAGLGAVGLQGEEAGAVATSRSAPARLTLEEALAEARTANRSLKSLGHRRNAARHDAKALAVFQEAFPGYEIVGVDHDGCGFNDALHCRTRNFVKRDALRIYPDPPGDTEDTAAGYEVRAEVIREFFSALLSRQTYCLRRNPYILFGLLWGLPVPLATWILVPPQFFTP